MRGWPHDQIHPRWDIFGLGSRVKGDCRRIRCAHAQPRLCMGRMPRKIMRLMHFGLLNQKCSTPAQAWGVVSKNTAFQFVRSNLGIHGDLYALTWWPPKLVTLSYLEPQHLSQAGAPGREVCSARPLAFLLGEGVSLPSHHRSCEGKGTEQGDGKTPSSPHSWSESSCLE